MLIRQEWLIKLRHEKGLSQRELAEKAGIKPNYISDIERGYRSPSAKVAYHLSIVLECDMARFYDVRFKKDSHTA